MPNTHKQWTRYHIEVTEADIVAATRNDSRHCAVSTAVQRAIPNAHHTTTDIQTIRFSLTDEQVRRVYLTPARVTEYVVAFDAGDPIEPFSFDLLRPAYIRPIRHNNATKANYTAVVATDSGGGGSDGGSHADRVSESLKIPIGGARVPSSRHLTDRQYGLRRMRQNRGEDDWATLRAQVKPKK